MLMRLREERGLAMVVSLLVVMVVTLLSIAVVAQSIHDLDASGNDRKRFLSVNAAEAGTNSWYEYLQTTPLDEYTCDPITATVQTQPATASFSAEATFYAADGSTEMTCPFSTTTYPSYAKIVSTGTLNGTDRQMETFMRLTPNYGGFGAAILGIDATAFNNSFNVYGDVGNDGDIYILNGNLEINNALTVNGNIYVPEGSAHLENGSVIKGNLWARDDVTIENPAEVEGAVLSSEGGVFGTSTGGTIDGSATASGDIDDTLLTIGGTVSPYTYIGDVPTHTFPQITSSTTNWTDAGYTLVTFSGATACTNAYNYIRNSGAGTWAGAGYPDTVIRIAATCNLQNGNNHTITVGANLAIVSDGGFNLQLRSNWNAATTVKKLYFISAYTAAACTGTKDISVGNNTNFNSFVQVFFYTPCTATMGNTNAFEGQVMAKTVNISNNFKVNYEAVLVPGIAEITGFKQDISYVREI
jgi:Tfp pilus assembly protein PilX